jgi:hypothetical protein
LSGGGDGLDGHAGEGGVLRVATEKNGSEDFLIALLSVGDGCRSEEKMWAMADRVWIWAVYSEK